MVWEFVRDHWRHGIEILILTIGVYQIYRAFKATRGARILLGLVVILVVMTALLQLFKFQVITLLAKWIGFVLVIALPVIFQPELRTALARVGSSRWLEWLLRNDRRQMDFLENLNEAVVMLSKRRIGALFAIERDISLKLQQETGVELNADFSPELAITVFFPKSPLHDGGMLIVDEKVAAAACVFPVSQRELSDRSVGLRHRAAIGLTEETDAVCVVVSEETGSISICIDGKIERNLGEVKFRERMTAIFLNKEKIDDEDSSPESNTEDDSTDPSDRDMAAD